MPVSISGDGAVTGVASVETPTTLSGLTIPTTGFGKVLQVVRATDTVRRTTSSTSFSDASISVSITPLSASSAIMLIWSAYVYKATSGYSIFQITDSSNVAIQGAQQRWFGATTGGTDDTATIFAYDTPATTSALTYKVRFRSDNANTAGIANDSATGQLFAIEIAA